MIVEQFLAGAIHASDANKRAHNTAESHCGEQSEHVLHALSKAGRQPTIIRVLPTTTT